MRAIDTLIHRWLRVPYTLETTITHKTARNTVVFLHGIGNSKAAWKEVSKQLPPHVRTVSIDLLGFGESPQPRWATYNAKTQARSVRTTLLSRGILGTVTIVGHSLGALVAIEYAKRYPFSVKQLVLCSPPLYRPEAESSDWLSPERALRRSFTIAIKQPNEFLQLAATVKKYNILNPSFHVDENNLGSYMATLHAMIVNQTSLHDLGRLSLPVHIMKGAIDPLIVASNYTWLKEKKPNLTIQTVAAGHEVVGTYATAVSRYIEGLFPAPKKR